MLRTAIGLCVRCSARHKPLLDGTTDVAREFGPERMSIKLLDGVPTTAYYTGDFTLAEIKTLRAVQPVASRPQAYDGRFEIPTFGARPHGCRNRAGQQPGRAAPRVAQTGRIQTPKSNVLTTPSQKYKSITREAHVLHAPNSKVPFADSVAALAEAQRAGKIRHVGLSNVSVKQIEQARRIVPIVSVQNRHNVDDRAAGDVLSACERLGIAFLPWFPLGTGSALRSAGVKRIAARVDATPAQVLLAWLLAKSPVMLPISGTASLAHLDVNAAAATLKLSAADLTALG